MSANDFIEITRSGKEYIVAHADADSYNPQEVKRFTSLKKAIIFAEKYVQEHMVEYGIHFSNIV